MPLLHARFLFAALLFAVPSALAQNTDCPTSQQVVLTIQNTPQIALPGQPVRYAIFATGVTSTADPGGDLTFFDNTTNLGTATLGRFGQTTFSATFYSAGPRQLRINYTGDITYCAAVYSFTQVVDRLTPAIAISSSAVTATAGTPVSFTAQISPAPAGVAAAAGPVQFFDNGTLLGAADLVRGVATLSTNKLIAGTHQITATLVGDLNWFSVRTGPLAVTISTAPTFTLLTGNATATDVTFKVSVTSTGTTPQTGTVQLVDTSTNTPIGTLALPSTSVTLPLAKVPAGHAIEAVYTEGVSYSSSTSATVTLAAFQNAAGAPSANIAPDEIVSLFASGFAGSTAQSSGAQPPTTLGGVTVTITDRTGTSRNAGLYLVSPTQINLIVPAAVTAGPATLAVTGSTAAIIPIQLTVAAVAPGLFNPGPQVLHVAPDGTQTLETITASTPVVVGPNPTYLVLYATGLRNRTALSAVSASVGNLTLPVIYAGPQTQFAGLDQVDILLPDSLKGAGKVNLTLTVDSAVTNTIPLQFQ